MTEEMRRLIEEEKAVAIAENKAIAIPIEKAEPKAKDLIDTAINSAIVERIKTNENVQAKFIKTADTVIENKLETEQSKAEGEAKEAHLKNNQDACDLYGIDEKTVPKWVVNIAVKVQNLWYAFWLVVGFFTTAPIVFLSKKIKVVFHRTWVAVILAIIIYLAVILTPILTALLK